MNEEIKQMAEAKALEKYPVNTNWSSHNGTIDFNEDKRQAYVQGIIDTYKEHESVNEKLVDALKSLERFDCTYDGQWLEVGGKFVEFDEMIKMISQHQERAAVQSADKLTTIEELQGEYNKELRAEFDRLGTKVTNKWISVNDMFPDADTDVLCSFIGWDDNRYHKILSWCKIENEWADWEGTSHKNVTHWQPLSNPPKEK